MATKRLRSNGSWELRITRKGLLPKPVYMTFDTEAEADRYSRHVESLLDKGVVPPECVGGSLDRLGPLLDLFEASTRLSDSDRMLFPTLRKDVAGTRLALFDYNWVESWVAEMKERGLAPSTLTKRVGLLARCVDWGMRTNRLALVNNPLRLLPKGYASKGRVRSWDGERCRRLDQAEEWALRRVIKEKYEALLFELALETGMRLREMYTLTWGQIDLDQSTIFLDKTKNGDNRQVPMTSVIKQKIAEMSRSENDPNSRVFPYLKEGEPLETCTQRLSHRFAYRVRQAKLKDLRFHDLRHEATSRFFEKTRLTDTEIASITGHKDPRMLKRYANLRGSTLSTKLW